MRAMTLNAKLRGRRRRRRRIYVPTHSLSTVTPPPISLGRRPYICMYECTTRPVRRFTYDTHSACACIPERDATRNGAIGLYAQAIFTFSTR